MEQKTQTIRDFITECECYEYSQEHYDLMKEAYEIDLMERYIANQAFVLENADVINTEDGYTFTEGMFIESSSIDVDNTVTLMEAAEQKKDGFFKKVLAKIKALFKRLAGFFKSILTKEGRANHKAAKEMWDSIGGDKGVMEYLKQLGNDTKYAQKLVDDKADETGINDYQRDRLKRRVKKLAKKNGPAKDVNPTEDEYEYNKESVEFTEAVKSNGASDVMQNIADNCSKGNKSGTAILNAVNKRIFEMKPQLKEFFDPSSSRNVVYAIDFGAASRFNKIVDVVAADKYNIKVIKNANNIRIINPKETYNAMSPKSSKEIIDFANKYFAKNVKKFSIDFSTKELKAFINALYTIIDENGNTDKFENVFKSTTDQELNSMSKNLNMDSSYLNDILTKSMESSAEFMKFMNALLQYRNAFYIVVSQMAKEVKKVKVTKISK